MREVREMKGKKTEIKKVKRRMEKNLKEEVQTFANYK